MNDSGTQAAGGSPQRAGEPGRIAESHVHMPAEAVAHIDAVRNMYTAFARGDLNAILDVLDPDIVWSEPDNPWNPAAGTRHGHAGFQEWARVGHEAEEVMFLEPRQFLAGDDTVAVVGRTRCRVKATGRMYETDFVHLVTFAGGRVVRFQEFFDTYTAAEAFR